MWAHRVVFGFPLRYELAGSAALLVAYNVSNLWYNATASERLRPFWEEKGLDLARHQRWSLALGNMGLGFRLFKRVLVYAASVAVSPTVPSIAQLAPGWEHPVAWLGCSSATAWAVALVVLLLLVLTLTLTLTLPLPLTLTPTPDPNQVLLTPLTAGAQLFQFHCAHMWLHSNAALYRLVHKVHPLIALAAPYSSLRPLQPLTAPHSPSQPLTTPHHPSQPLAPPRHPSSGAPPGALPHPLRLGHGVAARVRSLRDHAAQVSQVK